MSLSNEITLRPRFKFEVDNYNEDLLTLFEGTKTSQSDFVVTRVDDHVFIRIPKEKQHFWSPQLHLEINKNEIGSKSTIYGLFGPNPTVWTLFMFLHFFVVVVFIGFGAWAYSNWTLENPYGIQIGVMIFMVISWIVLYLAGRLGKKAGMNEMHQLHHFMRDTLRSKDIHALQ